ncbi:bifunctional isochorismate lyase / aryl carrier protein [Evansella caseinilytica]|uniref:isochorismatase n=1 Tax=Evansella caseinilytica TaxID=1503961 RepID=A0A1H3STV5_9BACI|nr:bifunctional isochorismate lyase / aryl carrier protein [Evansella caseinilytica]
MPKNKVAWRPDSDRAILLIHDMQNYFLRAYQENESPLSELLQQIKALKSSCRELNIPVVYSVQPGGQPVENRGLLQDFWGEGIADNPEETDIHSEISPDEHDVVITKWRYSALKKTDLLERMKQMGRDQLIICGVYAHIGCLMTASEAFMEDIQPFFVVDAVADFSLEDHKMAIRYAAGRCAVTLSAEQLMEELQKRRFPLSHHHFPNSLEELREQVAEMLEEDPAQLSAAENLLDRGLDSIRMMSLVEKWRSNGAEITFVDLAEQPTLSNWLKLLAHETEKSVR